MGHSMSDPITGTTAPGKRSRSTASGPDPGVSEKLKADGIIDERGIKSLDADVISEVEDAYRFADAAPDPEPGELWTMSMPGTGNREPARGRFLVAVITYRDALNQRSVKRCGSTVGIPDGRGSGRVQGAYKVSRGLLDEFDRCAW